MPAFYVYLIFFSNSNSCWPTVHYRYVTVDKSGFGVPESTRGIWLIILENSQDWQTKSSDAKFGKDEVFQGISRLNNNFPNR